VKPFRTAISQASPSTKSLRANSRLARSPALDQKRTDQLQGIAAVTVIAVAQPPARERMDEMSARQYRKVAALALVTTVGLSLAACSDKSSSTDSNGKTTIIVDCAPLKTDNDGKKLAQWNSDIAAFEKLHPDVVIKSISVGAQCDTPADFTARLQGGTEADVFYGYMTDVNQVLDADQATDITSYINNTTIPTWGDITDGAKAAFTQDGKVYAVPFYAYSMGLVINKTLFAKAGLDPSKPPATWADVATDAAAIAKLGGGVAGYEEYSSGNTGGWHFTAEVDSRGGSVVSSDGKTANVNTPEGQAVLQTLKDMRFKDNSVGSKQLLGWADLLTNAAAGKVGMYIGAPDSIQSIVNQFHGSYADWALAPMPGADGAAKSTLGGGNGYFFKKGDTPAQIKAGLEWLAYEDLTPGQGQFNYAAQKGMGQPVGLPLSDLWTPGSASQKKSNDLEQANTNLTLADYANYVNNPVPTKLEPPNAQAIYAVLDSAMSAVLTQSNANIPQLLTDATTKINGVLAQGS
jgi:ABC-type glycerol-3-phosphate transport system substrate-binding protein